MLFASPFPQGRSEHRIEMRNPKPCPRCRRKSAAQIDYRCARAAGDGGLLAGKSGGAGEKHEAHSLKARCIDLLYDRWLSANFSESAGERVLVNQADFASGKSALLDPAFQILAG